MTFTEIVTQVTEDLNISATASVTRVGRTVNIRYKRLVSTLGLDTSKRTTETQNASIGSTEITFSTLTKVTRIADVTDGTVTLLKEVTWDELREETPGASDSATRYAIKRVTASGVVVAFDVTFQTATPAMRADGYETTSTLSGVNEPAFPEDFHDILVWGAKADELLKMEKAPLAKHCEDMFEKRLSQLRLFLAKSNYLDRRQGARDATSTAASGSSSSGSIGETAYTQTALVTFDRDPAAPFAVTSGSAKVANLDADLLDGHDSSYFGTAADVAALAVPDYLTKTATGTLSAERVVTDGTAITFDWTVAGVVKAVLGQFTGDVTSAAANGLALTIGALKVVTGMIAANAVTFTKFVQASATAKIVARKSASNGDYEECSITDILDFVAGTPARGDILYRGAATWSRLAKGSTGQILTQGANDPAWGANAGGAIVFTAQSNNPPAANYATPDLRNAHSVLDFDGATDEEAVFQAVLPAGYSGNGLTVDTYWAFTSATSGSLRVQADIERMDVSSLDTDADSFSGTFQSAGGTAPGTSGQLIKVTITFTSGAQMDSLAAGEAFRLKIRRDADGTSGTDDIATDAELFRIVVKET